MNYQIFISYRRDGGDTLGQLFHDRLSSLGYTVFFDVEALRSGNFSTKIYSVIDECKDFILILPPNGLDRCVNEEDWVRKEIEYAIFKKKNIVPIMARGFEFPSNLPDTLKDLPLLNGVKADMELFDGVILKLQQMLYSKPSGSRLPHFEIMEDPDFPSFFKDYERLGIKSPDEDSIYDASYKLRMMRSGKASPSKRSVVANVEEDCANIYDIFEYQNKKYAYALQENTEYNKLPRVLFYQIHEDDSLELVRDMQEYPAILMHYGVFHRLLSVMPESLKSSWLKYTHTILAETVSEKERWSFNQLSTECDFYQKLPDWKWVDRAMDQSQLYTCMRVLGSYKNLIAPEIVGYTKKALFKPQVPICITCRKRYNPTLYLVDEKAITVKEIVESPYEMYPCEKTDDQKWTATTRFLNSYIKNRFRTPLDEYTIIDIAKVDFQVPSVSFKLGDDMFVVLAYPQRNKQADNLIEDPTFFLVTRKSDCTLSVSQIVTEENKQFYLESTGLKERFALSAGMSKTIFPEVFDDTVRLKRV